MSNFKELRDSLSSDDIIKILRTYGVEPYKEQYNAIIFPTCCHNLTGGSPKLYYFKDSHMFKCYTECNELFDIFTLIIKIENLRGNTIGLIKAVEKTGLKIQNNELNSLADDSVLRTNTRLYKLANIKPYNNDNIDLQPIDVDFMNTRYVFDADGLDTWVKEGISLFSMLLYRVTYDPIDNCIIVPQFDAFGNVVGIRGRFLNADAKEKYKPIIYNNIIMRHPTSKTLYGYYQNKEAIKITKSCIIFEGEKSVLKMDTIYNTRNIAVALCGQTISKEHVALLRELGVNNVVVAFDADYLTPQEAKQKEEEYRNNASILLPYFIVSIIMDYTHMLGYKDSPIDKGEIVFRTLMQKRIFIK